MSMIKCLNCRKPNPIGTQFCLFCNRKFWSSKAKIFTLIGILFGLPLIPLFCVITTSPPGPSSPLTNKLSRQNIEPRPTTPMPDPTPAQPQTFANAAAEANRLLAIPKTEFGNVDLSAFVVAEGALSAFKKGSKDYDSAYSLSLKLYARHQEILKYKDDNAPPADPGKRTAEQYAQVIVAADDGSHTLATLDDIRVRYLIDTLVKETKETTDVIATATNAASTMLENDYGKKITRQRLLEDMKAFYTDHRLKYRPKYSETIMAQAIIEYAN